MGIVVQKFGGQLVGSPARIRRAAAFVIATKEAGDDPVVVVSAPGRITDYFTKLAFRVAEKPDERELDMLLSVGERMGMSLLAMAINGIGRYKAVSFTGSQVGIITDTRHTNASIIEVKGYRIREAIAEGMIPIVAGFQGISTDKEITTLGRGGSDATAVALAAAIGAVRCELIKESGGVFTADPAILPEAIQHFDMDYATLEALTAAGAKVVQPRAAALAREHHVTLSVASLDGTKSTLVSDRTLSTAPISAIILQDKFFLLAGIANEGECGENFFWQRGGGWLCLTRVGGRGTLVDTLTLVGWGGQFPQHAVKVIQRVVAQEALALIRTPATLVVAVEAGHGSAVLRMVHTAAIAAGLFKRSGVGIAEDD